MKCIAIDDEPLALNVIKEFCSKIDYVELIATYTNPTGAIHLLSRNKIDLVFIDIHMPVISGIDFIKSIDYPVLVIFTTAYPNYALDGFELNAVDYLVKPISFKRFFKAVNKAYEMYTFRKNKILENNSAKTYPVSPKYLMIKVEYSTVRIETDKILYIEGLKDYVKIHSEKKPLLTKTTLKNLEEKLPDDEFIRVHKSFIISISKIDSIENNRILIGDKRIPVGNQYKTKFYRIINSKRI